MRAPESHFVADTSVPEDLLLNGGVYVIAAVEAGVGITTTIEGAVFTIPGGGDAATFTAPIYLPPGTYQLAGTGAATIARVPFD